MTAVLERRRRPSRARQARIRLASEAVVASYIHDISTRGHHPVGPLRYRLTANAKWSADAERSGHRQ